MPCKSCVEKRAKIYMDRGMPRAEAFERAEKIMPLIEKALNKRRKYGCFNALEEWAIYYVQKRFNEETAQKLAKVLLKGVEKRIGKRRSYLRGLIGGLIHLFFNRMFLTNWKATLKYRRWIGLGFNPDYTQACYLPTGATCLVNAVCEGKPDCILCLGIGCPPALPNSWLSGNTCNYGIAGSCSCPAGGGRCRTGSAACIYSSGVCSYTCNTGYVWNGEACVLPSVANIRKFVENLVVLTPDP